MYDHSASTARARGDFTLVHHSTVGDVASANRACGLIDAPRQPISMDEQVVCHCLHVSQTEVQVAVASGSACTLRDVMNCTGAGAGCTACHHRICEILASGGAQSPEPSPICIAR